MADELKTKRLSELPLASSIGDVDILVGNQGGVTKGFPGAVLTQGLVHAFATYAEARSYGGTLSSFLITGKKITGTFYLDAADTSSPDDNGVTLVVGGSRYKRAFTGPVRLAWFMPAANSTVDDLVVFNKAAAVAISMSNGTNKMPSVEVETGNYLVSSSTLPATWILAAGAEIFDLAGVAPSFVTDTQRLTGKMIRASGVDQYGVLFAGDTSYKVQKLTGRSYSAALVGSSNKAAGGVSGLTYTSARHEYDQASIGVIAVCVNDETTLSKPGWATYAEGWRLAGVPGNMIVNETQVYNLGNTYVDNPYVYVDDGPTAPGATYGLWMTSGGVAGCNDASFALGIGRVGTTARWQKGIVFKTNSVSSSEAVAAPEGYQFAWYKGNTQLKDAWISAGHLRQSSTDTACLIQHLRMGVSSTANNGLILNRSWSGNNAGVEMPLGGERVFQRSAIASTFAASAWDVSVKNSAGVDIRVALWPTTFRPDADAGSAAQLNLGDPSFRWNNSYFAVAPTVTSDAREKTKPKRFTPAETAAAIEISKNVGTYKWLSAVADKGKSAARLHIGMTVQSAIAIMESHGLDPTAYGFICYDEWDAEPPVVNDAGEEITPALAAGNRYGFRDNELLYFIAAGISARLEKLEAAE